MLGLQFERHRFLEAVAQIIVFVDEAPRRRHLTKFRDDGFEVVIVLHLAPGIGCRSNDKRQQGEEGEEELHLDGFGFALMLFRVCSEMRFQFAENGDFMLEDLLLLCFRSNPFRLSAKWTRC